MVAVAAGEDHQFPIISLRGGFRAYVLQADGALAGHGAAGGGSYGAVELSPVLGSGFPGGAPFVIHVLIAVGQVQVADFQPVYISSYL